MDIRHCCFILAFMIILFATPIQVMAILQGRDIKKNMCLLGLNFITYTILITNLCLKGW